MGSISTFFHFSSLPHTLFGYQNWKILEKNEHGTIDKSADVHPISYTSIKYWKVDNVVRPSYVE